MQPKLRWRAQPTVGTGSAALRERFSLPPLKIPNPDWHALLTARPNMLLCGPQSATDAMLRALEPHLTRPRCACRARFLQLPLKGTVILHEVAALGIEHQGHLFQWLDQVSEPIQIVCTTAGELFSLVENGGFLAPLYYRLNVVRLDLPLV